jgi:hypothetical protein
MKVYENKYAQAIFDILEPLVGRAMALGSIKLQAKTMGCNEESFTHSDLPKISEAIKKGLIIFIGTDAAQKVATQIVKLE